MEDVDLLMHMYIEIWQIYGMCIIDGEEDIKFNIIAKAFDLAYGLASFRFVWWVYETLWVFSDIA